MSPVNGMIRGEWHRRRDRVDRMLIFCTSHLVREWVRRIQYGWLVVLLWVLSVIPAAPGGEGLPGMPVNRREPSTTRDVGCSASA